jgi:hypothetical protein
MKNNNLKNLKQLFSLTLLVLLTLTSCNNSNKIEDECEAFLKNQLNDPKSYERISIKLTDTFRTSDWITRNSDIQTLPPMVSEDLSKYEIELAEYNKRNAFYLDSMTKVKERLLNNPNENEIIHISYTLDYRAKNALGALIKKRAVINYRPNETNPERKIFIYSNE